MAFYGLPASGSQARNGISGWGQDFLNLNIESDFSFQSLSPAQAIYNSARLVENGFQQALSLDGFSAITDFNFIAPSPNQVCNDFSSSEALLSDSFPPMNSQIRKSATPNEHQFHNKSLDVMPHIHPSEPVQHDFSNARSPMFNPQPHVFKGSNAVTSKRKMRDSMTEFPIMEGASPARKRTRRKFDHKTKSDVALVRKIGACIQCRIRKVQCAPYGACPSCIKASGNTTLGPYICIRQSLVASRFGIFDLIYVSNTQRFLDQEVQLLEGADRRLTLFFDHRVMHGPSLEVIVKDYKSPSDDNALDTWMRRPFPWDTVIAMSSKQLEFLQFKRGFYAIVDESLPTVDDLLVWALDDIRHTNTYEEPHIRRSFRKLLLTYCESKSKLPMNEFATQVLKIIALDRTWRTTILIGPVSEGSIRIRLSKTAARQIALTAKKGITDAETEVLTFLDKLIAGTQILETEDQMPIWICFWSLILLYRDLLYYYHGFSRAPCAIAKERDYPRLIEAAKHMYDALTVTYAAVFRNTTPLDLDWTEEQNSLVLGRDQRIINAVHSLRMEMTRLYERDDLSHEDLLLKTHIIAREKAAIEASI